jgi:TonB family protein
MSFSRASRRGAVLLIIWIYCAGAAIASDETLAQAKDLYATAAYDEALAVLDRLQSITSGKDSTAIAEYRAFCLLALDRREEARRTIEAILRENPLYLPSEDQASPRIQMVFRDTRRQLLPTIVIERYAAAKAAFERKDPQAAERFDGVLALLDDPDAQGVASLSDLRTVASAFRDLTKAMAAAAPPPPPAAAERAPESAPQAAGARPAAAVNPNVVYTAADADVIPPVALSQRVPRWAPHRTDAMQDFKGTLELLVDEGGAVTSATLRTSVHPVYDVELLKAVRRWKFAPAQKQGTPVRYVKIFEIRLTPGAPANGR